MKLGATQDETLTLPEPYADVRLIVRRPTYADLVAWHNASGTGDAYVVTHQIVKDWRGVTEGAGGKDAPDGGKDAPFSKAAFERALSDPGFFRAAGETCAALFSRAREIDAKN